MNEPITARHWLAAAAPKAAPAIATTTVLALARVWNANGAEHSVGNAVLMTALSLGAGTAGAFASNGGNGDSAATALAFTTSGAFALAGVSAYSDGWSLPLLLWAIATTVAYTCAVRYWRADRRETTSYERRTAERREEHAHIERVEAMRAGAHIEARRIELEAVRASADYAEALAQAVVARAQLPGFNPTHMTGTGLPELPGTYRTKED